MCPIPLIIRTYGSFIKVEPVRFSTACSLYQMLQEFDTRVPIMCYMPLNNNCHSYPTNIINFVMDSPRFFK